MTPEQTEQLNRVEKKLNQFLDIYNRTHFIDKDVFQNNTVFLGDVAFGDTKAGFFGVEPVAKQAAITAPASGVTVDAQARSSINEIIDVLQNLGFTQ